MGYEWKDYILGAMGVLSCRAVDVSRHIPIVGIGMSKKFDNISSLILISMMAENYEPPTKSVKKRYRRCPNCDATLIYNPPPSGEKE